MLDGSLELRQPEIGIGCWRGCVPAPGMPVPEAPMGKDHCSVFGQYKIRFPRQLSSMKSIAKATTVQRVSQKKFRPGILASNPRHHPGSGLLVYYIRHATTSSRLGAIVPRMESSRMPTQYGVVDLFAGPGGLAEGFSRVRRVDGTHPFKIELSVEKEASAHKTLLLRSFLRQFEDSYPDEYYDALNAGNEQPDWSTGPYRAEWDRAEHEALLLELGKREATDIVDRRIDQLKHQYNGNLILIGGPPCQAYSLVGRSRNMGVAKYVAIEDHRHYLYKEYIRILDRLQPAVFVMENVKGILSSTLEGEKVFERVLDDLQSVRTDAGGYRLVTLGGMGQPRLDGTPDGRDFLVRAEEYGVPQARHRVIVVGIREDIARLVYLADQNSGLLTKSKGATTVQNVIGSMPALRSGLSRTSDSDDLWRQAMQEAMAHVRDAVTDPEVLDQIQENIAAFNEYSIPPRRMAAREWPAPVEPEQLQCWLIKSRLKALPNHETRSHMRSDLARYFFAAVFAEIKKRSPKALEYPRTLAPAHKNWQSGKFADRFRVQRWGHPSTTVTSHISKDGHYFIHPDPMQCRSLTVREAARLQTFPDNYLFLGNRTQQYVQVGNAVPTYLAYQIGHVILRVLQRETSQKHCTTQCQAGLFN